MYLRSNSSALLDGCAASPADTPAEREEEKKRAIDWGGHICPRVTSRGALQHHNPAKTRRSATFWHQAERKVRINRIDLRIRSETKRQQC